MSDELTFVDTNVLLYAYDRSAGNKYETARSLLATLWQARAGVLSTQVLQEFYVNVTRKIPTPVTRRNARDLLQAYAAWPVVVIDGLDIQAATEIEDRYRLAFWDALIVRAAIKTNAEVLLSEDLHPGARIRDLRVENPFLHGGPARPQSDVDRRDPDAEG